jgi:hypothetical protein
MRDKKASESEVQINLNNEKSSGKKKVSFGCCKDWLGLEPRKPYNFIGIGKPEIY